MFAQLQNELCLKAITWNGEIGKFTSPSLKNFVWEKDGIETANCSMRCQSVAEPPYGPFDIPGDWCTCGLYGTFRWEIIGKGYTRTGAISPVCLMEVAGKTHIYTDGTRSQQQCIRAIINTWDDSVQEKFDKFNITSQIDPYGVRSTIYACAQAVDYFQVPLLTRDVATIVMDLQNTKLDMKGLCHDGAAPFLAEKKEEAKMGGLGPVPDYRPESSIVRGLKRNEIEEMFNMYLPDTEMEVEWSQLFGSR